MRGNKKIASLGFCSSHYFAGTRIVQISLPIRVLPRIALSSMRSSPDIIVASRKVAAFEVLSALSQESEKK